MSKIQITKTTASKAKPDERALGFGKYYTDHMLIIDYTAGIGWHDARIVPFGNLPLHPAAVVLHYGMEIFEGLKAYRRPDGKVQLFRPMENVRRMNNSARRLALPTMDEELGLEAIRTFVELEQDWVPSAPGTSLYLRPFLYASEPNLALHAVHEATYVLIASPVGSYFPDGLKPVRIMIENSDVRAVRGGTGEAKCGGNYAAATRAGDVAESKGYSQVLWLDGVERKYVDERHVQNRRRNRHPQADRLHSPRHHPQERHRAVGPSGDHRFRAFAERGRADRGLREGNARGGMGHRHGGHHLPHRRAQLRRPGLRHQRRGNRSLRAEAV